MDEKQGDDSLITFSLFTRVSCWIHPFRKSFLVDMTSFLVDMVCIVNNSGFENFCKSRAFMTRIVAEARERGIDDESNSIPSFP